MAIESDAQLLDQCRHGEHSSFEKIVRRYEVLVCSIAYSIVGDVALSEDIGQEAFLVMWRRLAEIRDPSRLKPWLATITRNLARASLRGKSKSEVDLAEPETVYRPTASPESHAMDREEQQLVWQTLENLPDTYREPLVLFYRQENSVSDVAEALELSPSAVKQRLARGREMLKDEVLATIERSLKKSVPTTAFAVGVLSALPGATKSAAAAVAVSGSAAAGKMGMGVSSTAGLAGALGGSILGVGGAFVGVMASWLTARYQSQRTLYVRYSILVTVITILFSIPYVAMYGGWKPWITFGSHAGMVFANLSWMAIFFVALGTSSLVLQRALKQTMQEAEINREPQLPQSGLSRRISEWEGRRFTSKIHLFGAPLIHVAFRDPAPVCTQADLKDNQPLEARGWIAIGDRARGRLLAIGNTAVAPIAIGTFTMGIFSFGVFGIGIISTGVICLGAISAGVIGLGFWSLSVIALGWASEGVLAFGVGSAYGVVAYSFDIAAGIVTNGVIMKTNEARALFADSRWHQIVRPIWEQAENSKLVWLSRLAPFSAPILIAITWFGAYRKKKHG